MLLRDKIWSLTWTCCLLALYIVTPGPAMIKTVFKYSTKFFSRISYLPSYAFLRRRRRFTSRKLYACLEKFFCFLQLSDRAKFLDLDVQGSFSFDSSRTTEFELNPYGTHQLPVYLKYCVRLKLLAQLVHRWECKTFCGLAQTSRGVYPCDGVKMLGFYWL